MYPPSGDSEGKLNNYKRYLKSWGFKNVKLKKQSFRAHTAEIADQLCDDPDDIKALRLYMTPDSIFNNESECKKIGSDQKPASNVIFEDAVELKSGEHYLWIVAELAPDANLHHKVSAICSRVTGIGGSIFELQSPEAIIKQRIGVAVRQHMQDDVVGIG